MDNSMNLNLVGRSPAFADALELVNKFAASDATVLIQGETGTGKELAARAIHYLGARRNKPFIAVNCGALPDTLVENELYGHARGAYTDARDNHVGLVASAEGGTLFLDEVEALSGKGQVVLLRFLQDGVYRPLGARATVAANVRVIVASNVSLSELVTAGGFRQDLLYRLALLTLTMPPLRERQGDIELLIGHQLQRLAAQYRRPKPAIDAASLDVLTRYLWPGNVRELENVVHRRFLTCEDTQLSFTESDLATPIMLPRNGDAAAATSMPFAKAKAQAIAQFERSYLHQALSDAEGNVTLAARRCGKERRSFGKLLKKYGIDRALYCAS